MQSGRKLKNHAVPPAHGRFLQGIMQARDWEKAIGSPRNKAPGARHGTVLPLFPLGADNAGPHA